MYSVYLKRLAELEVAMLLYGCDDTYATRVLGLGLLTVGGHTREACKRGDNEVDHTDRKQSRDASMQRMQAVLLSLL